MRENRKRFGEKLHNSPNKFFVCPRCGSPSARFIADINTTYMECQKSDCPWQSTKLSLLKRVRHALKRRLIGATMLHEEAREKEV
jgi:hypothetical protein